MENENVKRSTQTEILDYNISASKKYVKNCRCGITV